MESVHKVHAFIEKFSQHEFTGYYLIPHSAAVAAKASPSGSLASFASLTSVCDGSTQEKCHVMFLMSKAYHAIVVDVAGSLGEDFCGNIMFSEGAFLKTIRCPSVKSAYQILYCHRNLGLILGI